MIEHLNTPPLAPEAPVLHALDQPRSVIELGVNSDNFASGYERLSSMGLDPARIARLVVGGGGTCIGGSVAELMVMPEHADIAASIVETAQEAIASGRDPNDAVYSGLKFVLQKDPASKQLFEVRVDPGSLKKN